MGIHQPGPFETVLQRAFAPLFVLSGVIIATGFFFPDFVGREVPGVWWLTTALVFFGSGLGYLVVLPTASDAEPDTPVTYLLRIRRLGVVGNAKRFVAGHDPVVLGVPVLALLGFFVLQLTIEGPLLAAVSATRVFLTEQLGWLFMGVMLLSLVFSIYLMLGRWGDIRLGGPDAEPGYTYPVYFTMIFTAGIAAGIVFSGVSEPVTHYASPPPLFDVEPRSAQAADAALTYSLFHWGFTAWSAYLVIGLPIAYYVHERGAPLRVSAILTPFLGRENLRSPLGKTVDILAIVATIGGIATSVALLSQQFLTGIDYQWNVAVESVGPLVFVGGLTAIFVLSAQSGIHRGIRRVAALNLVLFVLFGLGVLLVGTGRIIEPGSTALAGYVVSFVPMSVQFGYDWVAAWTIWNWAWWFSWAPFAGLFLAALSRGRRIRTVVFTGVVATGLATMAWFVVLGGTALEIEHRGSGGLLAAIETHPSGGAVAGFPLLDALPLSDLLIFMFLALIIVFMTTSADTSTLVIAILSSEEGYAPTTATIVFWGILQGIVAISVIVTGSGELLQGAAVLTGGPFAVIAVVAMVGLVVGLRDHDGDHESIMRRAWRAIPERPRGPSR